jgi:hypothetical protein
MHLAVAREAQAKHQDWRAARDDHSQQQHFEMMAQASV